MGNWSIESLRNIGGEYPRQSRAWFNQPDEASRYSWKNYAA
jgi:hypothetical protein